MIADGTVAHPVPRPQVECAILSARQADQCPQWDSNPHCADFKSAASANWAIGAAPRVAQSTVPAVPAVPANYRGDRSPRGVGPEEMTKMRNVETKHVGGCTCRCNACAGPAHCHNIGSGCKVKL